MPRFPQAPEPSLPDEVWAPIPHHHYEVSNKGRVRNTASPTKRILKSRKIAGGSFVVALGYKYMGYPMQSIRSVRKLVADAFNLNPENLPIVGHKDGDISNCAADNLTFRDYENKSGQSSEEKYAAMVQGQQQIYDQMTYEEQQAFFKGGEPVDGVRLKNPDGSLGEPIGAPRPVVGAPGSHIRNIEFTAKNASEQRWWDQLTWNEKQKYLAKLRRERRQGTYNKGE